MATITIETVTCPMCGGDSSIDVSHPSGDPQRDYSCSCPLCLTGKIEVEFNLTINKDGAEVEVCTTNRYRPRFEGSHCIEWAEIGAIRPDFAWMKEQALEKLGTAVQAYKDWGDRY